MKTFITAFITFALGFAMGLILARYPRRKQPIILFGSIGPVTNKREADRDVGAPSNKREADRDVGAPSNKREADRGVGAPSKTTTKTKPMLEITITNEQKVKVALAPKTQTGKPSAIQEGTVKITVQSGDSTATVNADNEKELDLVSSDTPGDTMFLVEADADVGEGVETISDIIKLTVAGARAANLGLVAGTPEAK